MTIDIGFGEIAQKWDVSSKGKYGASVYLSCDFPGVGKEDDGTSSDFTCFSGRPIRSFSIHGFHEWLWRVEEARTLIAYTGRPDTNDFHSFKIDIEFMHLVERIPSDYLYGDFEKDYYKDDPKALAACDTDRAKWFKYWTRRAKDALGDKAAIAFW